MRSEFCCKAYPLRKRLRLFGATVSGSLLYAAGTWTLTEERVKTIRAAQRRVIRAMLGHGSQVRKKRRESGEASRQSSSTSSSDEESKEEDEEEDEDVEGELEPWCEWVQRVNKMTKEEMQKAGICDWVSAVRQQIWRLAGHIARRSDGRWSTKMLDWTPDGERRRHGRPLKRWHEDIMSFFQSIGAEGKDAWRMAAACREEWASYEQEFSSIARKKASQR